VSLDRVRIHGDGLAEFECVEVDDVDAGVDEDAPLGVAAAVDAGQGTVLLHCLDHFTERGDDLVPLH